MAEIKEIFNNDSVHKVWKIKYSGGEIGNDDIQSEELTLEESICTKEELTFGCCNASCIQFRVLNSVISLEGKWIEVSCGIEDGDSEYKIGRYKVSSDKPTADRKYRDITAYDILHEVQNMDVAAWYNSLTFPMTLRQFRDAFCRYAGMEQEETELINDGMTVEKTINPSEISGKDVLTAICEINGRFGHVGRDGKLQYIQLLQMIEGVYPAEDLYPADELYPADPLNAVEIGTSLYTSCQYEDYRCKEIDRLQIREEENDIGAISGTGSNCYIIEDNFLVYGKTAADLQTVADNIYSIIHGIWYQPATVEAKGNPCIEVGTGIRLATTDTEVYTYVLQRTLKGAQALKDTYTAAGEKYRSGELNGLQKSIIQLKGKTNTLTRTVEETRLEMRDIEQNLSTEISITAEGLTAEIKRATEAEGNMSAQISVNAQQILTKVSKDNIVSEINQTAESIKIKAERIDLVGLVNATEFVSKYATIETLNVTSANLQILISYKASIEQLETVSERVGSLEADHVTAKELDAVSSRLQTVESNYITAGTVKADYMEVDNWTSGGYIKAERLDVNTLVAKIGSYEDVIYAHNLKVYSRFVIGDVILTGSSLIRTLTIGGKSYQVVCAS